MKDGKGEREPSRWRVGTAEGCEADFIPPGGTGAANLQLEPINGVIYQKINACF